MEMIAPIPFDGFLVYNLCCRKGIEVTSQPSAEVRLTSNTKDLAIFVIDYGATEQTSDLQERHYCQRRL